MDGFLTQKNDGSKCPGVEAIRAKALHVGGVQRGGFKAGGFSLNSMDVAN